MSYKATNKAGQHQHLWLTSLIAHVRLYLGCNCCTPFFCILGIHGEATPPPTNKIILPASRTPTPDLESDDGSDSDDHSEPLHQETRFGSHGSGSIREIDLTPMALRPGSSLSVLSLNFKVYN